MGSTLIVFTSFTVRRWRHWTEIHLGPRPRQLVDPPRVRLEVEVASGGYLGRGCALLSRHVRAVALLQANRFYCRGHVSFLLSRSNCHTTHQKEHDFATGCYPAMLKPEPHALVCKNFARAKLPEKAQAMPALLTHRRLRVDGRWRLRLVWQPLLSWLLRQCRAAGLGYLIARHALRHARCCCCRPRRLLRQLPYLPCWAQCLLLGRQDGSISPADAQVVNG